MKKLFGTDGIRAVAGRPPLDAPTVYAIGLALAHTLAATTPSPRILLGMDTRESSEWIAATLTAGLTAGKASVESAGVITTPAVAFLTHTHRFDAGVVISASHNPWQDNGIKLFGPDGYKLPDTVELAIEEEIFRQLAGLTTPPQQAIPPAVNGDAVLLLAGRDLQARGLLTNSTVVATTMSNMGLEAALKRSGIQMLRAAVGDKYVLEQMIATGAALGGEQSGHIIFTGRSTTGDGLLTALLLLDIVHRSRRSLAELVAALKGFPQVIVNVKVREKKPL